ncbi:MULTISPECIES: MDR family MFS transporter [Methylosinus]|uniref:MFS transporter n=1 Tax=Methylosinus trichosporium (strain ATCC 35070 / NCIMB 11131 / UNIQEM 75 / OB3b) TaxID=595536 RepID=A0A2D2D2Y8_METT3|nr:MULTISPECIES: MDR family MFS transporter [Methylosinus]ATQ69335.1 MFS transporter [Methylosinus trichosporium OB3b]
MNKPPTELSRQAPTKSELIQIMVGLGLAMLLSALDQSIVATAMPTIAADLGDFVHLPWIVTAYLVASTAVTPLYGKLADIHGARAMLLIGVAIFVAGSVFCALAPSMGLLALARAVQGMGGGGLIALAQTVIADLVTPRERGRMMTYFSIVFIAASVGGPALGGVFAEHLHWSLIFWINVPLGLVAFAMSWFHLRRLPQRRHPHRLDIAGAALLVVGSSVTQLALSWGGERLAWSSAPMLALLAAAAAAWALFAWRTRAAEEPLIPLDVLGDSVVRDATLSGAFGLGTFIALTMFLPIYFEGALGLTADQSGLALIPLTIATVTGATISGRLMSRIRHYKAAPLIGLGAATLAMAALWLALGALSLAALDALLAVVGLGVGAMLPVTTVAVQNAVPAHNLGTATAVTQFSRQLGGVFIVAIFGAIVIGGGPVAAPEALRAAFRTALGVAALLTLASFLFMARMEQRDLHGEG